MDCITTIGTALARRWFRSEPLPDEVLDQLLWAATWASSAHNSPPWDLLVIDDPR
jgi:nitroreductase